MTSRPERCEAQLKAKSDQLEEFAHALDLAPAMVRALDGRILLWGRGLQSLYGWTPEEAIGRIFHELLKTEFPFRCLRFWRAAGCRRMAGELVHSHRSGRPWSWRANGVAPGRRGNPLVGAEAGLT